NMLIIDPDECIDCTLCVPECPVEAIFAEDDVPDAQTEFIEKNRELAKLWKPIIERKPAPADADEGAKVKAKKHLLQRRQERRFLQRDRVETTRNSPEPDIFRSSDRHPIGVSFPCGRSLFLRRGN